MLYGKTEQVPTDLVAFELLLTALEKRGGQISLRALLPDGSAGIWERIKRAIRCGRVATICWLSRPKERLDVDDATLSRLPDDVSVDELLELRRRLADQPATRSPASR